MAKPFCLVGGKGRKMGGHSSQQPTATNKGVASMGESSVSNHDNDNSNKDLDDGRVTCATLLSATRPTSMLSQRKDRAPPIT